MPLVFVALSGGRMEVEVGEVFELLAKSKNSDFLLAKNSLELCSDQAKRFVFLVPVRVWEEGVESEGERGTQRTPLNAGL